VPEPEPEPGPVPEYREGGDNVVGHVTCWN